MTTQEEATKVYANLQGDADQIAHYLVARCGEFIYDRERAAFIAEFLRAATESRLADALAQLDAVRGESERRFQEWIRERDRGIRPERPDRSLLASVALRRDPACTGPARLHRCHLRTAAGTKLPVPQWCNYCLMVGLAEAEQKDSTR